MQLYHPETRVVCGYLISIYRRLCRSQLSKGHIYAVKTSTNFVAYPQVPAFKFLFIETGIKQSLLLYYCSQQSRSSWTSSIGIEVI